VNAHATRQMLDRLTLRFICKTNIWSELRIRQCLSPLEEQQESFIVIMQILFLQFIVNLHIAVRFCELFRNIAICNKYPYIIALDTTRL